MTTHVVGLSGGKDSVCLALALKERHPDRLKRQNDHSITKHTTMNYLMHW